MLGFSRWRRLERLGTGGLRWYYAAAIGLIIVAAALRFYELGQPLVHHDEVVAALNSGGTLAEVVDHTRTRNSSPLLYPLILYAVQRIDVSPFSIRFVPALAGVLTVGVILLLPRFGVRRDAALLAALLATLAPAAIYEARGAREYGVDALVAALLIAGLLWYRNAGRKGLLCAALLVAPLLQYGLVLFGVAVIGAGLLLPPRRTVSAQTGLSRRERLRYVLRRRIGMAGPAAFFLAGCVISYLTTLRYQMETFGSGFAYYRLYLSGDYQAVSVLEFAIARVGDIVSHHLPTVVIIAVASAVVICLLSAGVKRLSLGRDDSGAKAEGLGGHWEVVAALFALAVAVAVGAAVLGQYPANQTRHITYLGPAAFVFSGSMLAAVSGLAGRMSVTNPSRKRLKWAVAVGPAVLRQDPARPSQQITFLGPRVFVFSSRTLPAAIQWLERRLPFTMLGRRRVELASTLAIVAAAVIICGGIVAIRQDSPYRVAKAADFFSILDQSVHTDDIVYITGSTVVVMSFYDTYYGKQLPDNYIQGSYGCWNSYTACIRELVDIIDLRESEVGNVWIVSHHNLPQKLERYDERGTLEFLGDFYDTMSKITIVSLALQRFPANGGLLDSVRREWSESDQAAQKLFKVRYDDGQVTYDREPCAPADTEARFFLHLYPAESLDVLPEHRRRHGFDNLDFYFSERDGMLLENRCVVSVTLPDYIVDVDKVHIGRIHTGQYGSDGRVWAVNISVLDRTRYAAAAAGSPAARSLFNLHYNGDTLLYAKSRCAPDDIADPFFLHLYPADLNVLSKRRRPHGYEARDFKFDYAEVRFDDQCLISIPLPDYDIASIHTGQYTDAGRIWDAEFAP